MNTDTHGLKILGIKGLVRKGLQAVEEQVLHNGVELAAACLIMTSNDELWVQAESSCVV